ncbi:phosphoglycerate mutase-like protein [Wolfiporia cocos MD-104 SS10]|uniref:Phosphoglycerate mutase-like protein n=1 Tax=Wolfiporia cocos (strain MD-104) TaxID=742152 RepID=A0A2H3JIX0_WOLCO|nr:phosphoglycerate mutase-like protein [Wolfiporia cocos MD-104 SS10]
MGALPPRLGLRDDSSDRWAKFCACIAELNASAPTGTTYKVLFIGRHGQGYHNVGKLKYGAELWNDVISRTNGDAETIWGPDPLLTSVGISQAEAARAVWLAEVPHDIPVPQRCYSSPLHRALDTWRLIFGESDLLWPAARQVTVLEDLRETYGEHTCDKRNPLSVIRRTFPPPQFLYEEPFSEEDVLHQDHEREAEQHVNERGRAVLDRIWREPDDIYISITAHGGIINGLLQAMGHQHYSVPTGGIMPLVVKCEALIASP